MRQDRSGTTLMSAEPDSHVAPVSDWRRRRSKTCANSALSVTRQKSGGHPERRTLWDHPDHGRDARATDPDHGRDARATMAAARARNEFSHGVE